LSAAARTGVRGQHNKSMQMLMPALLVRGEYRMLADSRAHGANEYVPVQQVIDACKVYASLMDCCGELAENE
jgi:acetylornithine deacetylase/succinyl-diaminopimelate desuccinylase-like protein